MKRPSIGVLLLAAVLFSCTGYAATDKFSRLHNDLVVPKKDYVLKKVIFVCGLLNACYHGMNDLVDALMLAKETSDPKAISAQLFAVKVGLDEKPKFFHYLAKEIQPCESYPNFPLGFPDSPEGPEKISQEMINIADHIEKLNVKYDSTDINFLRKEADRVVFAIFWTDSEKIRTLASDMLNFLRKDLKEDLPFDIYQKPHQLK